jgi:hypothetical protein
LLENSFGPETQNLAQHLKLEHYKNGSFVNSVDNNCVSVDASNISLSDAGLNPSLSGVNRASESFVNGETKAIELSAPGEGNQGAIRIYRTDDSLFNLREVFD